MNLACLQENKLRFDLERSGTIGPCAHSRRI
jgi:hypothetical protein